MPNWVKTIVHAVKDDVNFKDFADGDRDFSFEKIIPMPDDIFRGNLGQEEREKYGEKNWYDWSIEHWGTKWNACEPNIYNNGRSVDFDTAWSVALPVLKELGKMVGGIIVFYADEGDDANSGMFIVNKDGEIEDMGTEAVSYLAIYSGKSPYDREDVIEEYYWKFEDDEDE